MADVRLLVNGREYAGWTSARITRGLEAIAGSFSLSVSERWGGPAGAWPIADEDACEVQLEKTPILSGYIDVRSHGLDAESHTLSVQGRDKAGALVDCSAVLERWEFARIGVLELCTLVAAPFGVSVRLQDGLADAAISTSGATGSRKLRAGAPNDVGSAGRSSSMTIGRPNLKFTINPGDSPFDVIDRACRMVGVLPVSDGVGGVVLTRAASTLATTSLVEGRNVLRGSATFDVTKRYRRYVVSGQQPGSDDVFGAAAASVTGVATDENVRRAERVLLVRPEGGVALDFAKQRAAWEATVRAARAGVAELVVQGWRQADGTLWPINAVADVRCPTLSLEGAMLITEATYDLTLEGGTTTTLKLVRPLAFIPEPTLPATTKTGGDRSFREILGQ